MSRIFLLNIILLLLSNCCFAQSGVNSVSSNKETVYTIVEDMPNFLGGNDSLSIFIETNIQYPESAINDSIEGKVYLSFVVNQNGDLTEIKIISGVREDLNQEAIKVVKSMPKWEPGIHRGKKVKVRYNLPIHFKLDRKK